MASQNGGWHVVNTLHKLGVSDIFSLSGGHINPIYDAIADFGIRLIDTHHEQGAAMAADAYGRVKRQPAVCLVTAGPGFTNTLTGVAGAYLSNSPLIILSGKSGIEEHDRLPLQDIDQEAMAVPVTKWARTVYDTKRLPEYIALAYRKAISGKPGPVYIGMPYEVLYGSCPESKLDPYGLEVPDYRSQASEDAVAGLVSMLTNAKRPVLIAGSGAWYSGADEALSRFLELAPMPCFTLNFGRGVVPDDNPLCYGAASPSAPVGFKKITSEADLILLFGIRLTLYIGWGRTFSPDAKIVQVDIDPGEIGRNRPVDLGVVGDVGSVVEQLNTCIEQSSTPLDYKTWVERTTEWRGEEWSEAERIRASGKKPIHGMRVVKAVEDVLGPEGMLVIDGGDIQVWSDGTYRVRRPGHYVKGGLLGCMGVGVPFALGTKAAYPDRQVALISGDGALGMNFMEFETALRHKLPFVAVVCNDGAWGMTKHQLEISYGKDRKMVGVDLPQIPFHELIKTLGGYGELVAEPGDIAAAIERGFASGLPSIINVPIDPRAISPATYALTEMMMPKKQD
ncbi:MAG: thiamine pyrophosphate-binding protein [Candidatus Dadabacteria bacterium]|nr:thiamine pyrophosphate-binding protein [Candidatus Dadabacteria bacterium]